MKVRVRFNGYKNKFYVQKRYGLWPICWWVSPRDGQSYRPCLRYFETFEKAHEYAIKMAVDFEYSHKKHKAPLV